jgi:hypothetical protein
MPHEPSLIILTSCTLAQGSVALNAHRSIAMAVTGVTSGKCSSAIQRCSLNWIDQNKSLGEPTMQPPLVFTLIAALLAGGLAIAQSAPDNPPPPKRSKHFVKFDEKFNAADKNGDGALTKEEAASAGIRRIVENFDRIDADKDGKVTREEVRALIRHRVSS